MKNADAYISTAVLALLATGMALIFLRLVDATNEDRQQLAERAESAEVHAADAESRAEEAWMEVHRLRLQLIQAGGKP
jgi:hypothetical protein